MRDDWLRLEAVRPFLPAPLAKVVSVKAVALVTLALILLVIALKVKGA